MRLGRRDEGRRIAESDRRAARAAHAATFYVQGWRRRSSGEFHDANTFFRGGNKVAPQDLAINVAWGELFLDKYDPKNALQSFQDALKADENYIPAILGYAKVMLGEKPAEREAGARARGEAESELPACAAVERGDRARRSQARCRAR
jgi:hypothetical protein